MKILSFGEILWDIYPENKYIGGAPFNFAVHAVKSGASAFLLSAVGSDPLGDEAKNELTRFGVNATLLQTRTNKQTGKCLVTLDENALPNYELLQDVAYDYITFPQSLSSQRFDGLAFGTLALRSPYNLDTLRAVINANVCMINYCDLNLRTPFYTKETVRFCLQNANILKLSELELAYVVETFSLGNVKMETAVKSIVKKFENIKTVLITLGENGSFAYEKTTDTFTYCQAVKVKTVSTVGAGDSFGAAFLTAYLQGENIKGALQAGASRSAIVVSQHGAIF